MHIKEIVDKIIKEADVQTNSYSVADRIEDVNKRYLFYIEKAVQIGSKIPISEAETNSETFTVVAGSNTFTRTIQDVPIRRVDFVHENASLYHAVPFDQSRLIAGVNFGEMRFWADEKRVFVEEGYAGTLRVTYDRGGVTLFDEDDYNLGSAWPSPDFLPEVFHPLLWLDPAYRASRKWNKGRSAYIKDERDELRDLFNNHYGRESAVDSMFDTGRESNH